VRNRLAGRRSSPPDRHLQRVDDKLSLGVVGGRPANDAAAERVEHHRQIELAFDRRVFGDVHHPQPVGPVGVEGPLHQVVRRFDGGVTSGAAPAFAAVDASDTGLAHQPFDPFTRTPDAVAEAQLGVHPRRPIGAAAHPVDVDDGVGQ
jgi:hypothetical protein